MKPAVTQLPVNSINQRLQFQTPVCGWTRETKLNQLNWYLSIITSQPNQVSENKQTNEPKKQQKNI